MADQVTGMAKELSAITECSICLEVYEDPRILPCIHTFCLKCIESTGDGKSPGENMLCPVCREEFAIPKEGYGGLRKNFFMSKLIDIKSISSPSSKEKACDACKEDIDDTACEVPLAESFCMECHQNLCQECSKHHKKNKLTKTHKVIALGNPIDVSEFTRNFPLDLCHHHATKPLEMYCEDCRNLICMLCYAESHHHHKCSGVDRLVPEFRKKIKEDADKVSGFIVEKLKESAVMKKAKSDLLMEFWTAENAIVERDQQLRQLLDQQTKSLLEELASLKAEKLKEVGTVIDEIDRHITVMNSYQTYCLNVGETGSAFDICHAVDDLHSRAAQLEKAHQSRIVRDVNSQHQDLFQPTMLENFLINNNNNIVGKLQDGDETASVDSSFSTRELRRQAENLERQNEKLRRRMERVTKMRMWMEKDTRNSQILEKHEEQNLKDVEAKMAANQKKYKIRNYELTSRKTNRKKREDETERLRRERKDLEEELGQTVEDIRRLEVELETLSRSNVDLKAELGTVKKTNADKIEEFQGTIGSSILSLLPPQDLERLDRNQSFVTEACGDMNQRELLPMLASLNCITRVQRKTLDLSEDVQLLLNTIRSFSPANYDSFLVCLRKLDHVHIADLLDYGGVAIKLNVGVKKLDEDAKRRNPIARLNDLSNRETINKAFASFKVKFIRARLTHPTEDMSIEMWVWCQTENSLKVLNGALVSPKKDLLKQLVTAFEVLGIVQSGLVGMFMSSGKPISVTADQRQFTGTFCPYLPHGHIVRKVERHTPENGQRSAITGVAFLNDRAYVVSSGSSSIQVFQSGTPGFDSLPEIHVRGLHNPVDMCAGADWIYILERENECIYKVSASEASTSTPAVERRFEGIMAHAMSLTLDGHLMLTVRGPPSSLVICRTSDGTAIRDITLPGGMGVLWHGLATVQGDFVVSHRRGEAHQLSKIQGGSGTLCNSYTGCRTRLGHPLMDTPCHMTMDDEGQIYVADQRNRRVLLFDAELQVPRILLIVEGGGCPNRVSFNHETGQLLVGLDNGVVEVYAINEFKYHGIPEENKVNNRA